MHSDIAIDWVTKPSAMRNPRGSWHWFLKIDLTRSSRNHFFQIPHQFLSKLALGIFSKKFLLRVLQPLALWVHNSAPWCSNIHSENGISTRRREIKAWNRCQKTQSGVLEDYPESWCHSFINGKEKFRFSLIFTMGVFRLEGQKTTQKMGFRQGDLR